MTQIQCTWGYTWGTPTVVPQDSTEVVMWFVVWAVLAVVRVGLRGELERRARHGGYVPRHSRDAVLDALWVARIGEMAARWRAWAGI